MTGPTDEQAPRPEAPTVVVVSTFGNACWAPSAYCPDQGGTVELRLAGLTIVGQVDGIRRMLNQAHDAVTYAVGYRLQRQERSGLHASSAEPVDGPT